MGPVQESLALTAPLLQLGLPEANLAPGGMGMATNSWEIPACPSNPVSNVTSLEKPQPSEYSFPPYIVIRAHTVMWWSNHKLGARVPIPSKS